jgi:hypothetical protein
MLKQAIAAVIIGAAWAGPGVAGPLEDAYTAYQRGD